MSENTEPLAPRTARERALCRQAHRDALATPWSMASHTRYPEPPRELRKVHFTYADQSRWHFEYRNGGYLAVSAQRAGDIYYTLTEIAASFPAMHDTVLIEISTLPRDPYSPLAPEPEPRKVGYCVVREDGDVSSGWMSTDEAYDFATVRRHVGDGKIHTLLLGDEVPSND